MNVYMYIIIGMSASFILAASLVLFFISYKKNLLRQQAELREKEVQHQKTLLYTIISSQEAERKRIGMDLHDEVGANLSSLRLLIEDFADRNAKIGGVDGFNSRCKEAIDHIIVNTRNISHNLSPLLNKSYGFQDMICDYCDGVNSSGKISVHTTFEGDKPGLLEDRVALALYRIVTELINNTIKHARANLIALTFSVKGGLYQMDYRDDGIGISPDHKRGRGLQNIESRLGMIAASYEMDGTGNNGFGLKVTLTI